MYIYIYITILLVAFSAMNLVLCGLVFRFFWGHGWMGEIQCQFNWTFISGGEEVCALWAPVQHRNKGWISELLSIQATKCRQHTVDRKRCEIVVLLQLVSAAFYPKTMIRWANPTVFETFTTQLHTYAPWNENSTCHSSSNPQFSIQQCFKTVATFQYVASLIWILVWLVTILIQLQ